MNLSVNDHSVTLNIRLAFSTWTRDVKVRTWGHKGQWTLIFWNSSGSNAWWKWLAHVQVRLRSDSNWRQLAKRTQSGGWTGIRINVSLTNMVPEGLANALFTTKTATLSDKFTNSYGQKPKAKLIMVTLKIRGSCNWPSTAWKCEL